MRVFFCKFNDPIYVKLEKIEILIKVADKKNFEYILNELREYSNDIDYDLVIKSVKAIGHIVLKIDESAKKAAEIIKEIANSGTPVAL